MISSNITTNSPMSTVRAKVELYNGSTLVQTCTCGDYLQDFKVDRSGENNKFFGFGVCHSLKLKLIDLDNTLTVEKGYVIKIAYSTNDSEFIYPYPNFYVTEITRDDTASLINITAYDVLGSIATEHTLSEISFTAGASSPNIYITVIRAKLGLSGAISIGVGAAETCFETNYEGVINFDGSETWRAVLNAVAEVTQTIYYVDNRNYLIFKRLDMSGDPVFTIDKEDYMTFTFDKGRALTTICHATELGNNLEASAEVKDATQYIRNNPFWEKLGSDEDTSSLNLETLLNNALAAVNGLTIVPFTCEWFGNYFLEPGDKIAVAADDNSTVVTYLLSDSITYDGTIAETTTWQCKDEAETFSNPTSLGEIINQTYAKVDKANKQIDLVASESSANSSAIAALQINTESISASVKTIETTTAEQLSSLESEVKTVQTQVSNFKLESDNALLEFKTTIEEDGVTKVDTGTGFSFSEEGLVISKTDSSINTTITEDGMSITKNNEEVLRADNQGVKAEDLHATTWLIIGNNSRLEDYTNERGESRTGCFWIGG